MLKQQNVKVQDRLEEPAHVRDCRATILKSLAQRTSNRVPWYKPIGIEAAQAATSGMLNCGEPVPRDVLRALDLPLQLRWDRFARILGSIIPSEAQVPNDAVG